MPQMTIPQAMELAMQCMQAAQWQQADSIYRQILSAQPNNPEVLHLLSIASLQMRQLDQAEQFARRAMTANPANAEYPRGLGQILAMQQRLPEAVAAFRLAVSLRPNSVEALNDLGSALLQNRRANEAADVLRQAVAARADFPPAWLNLGNALRSLGQPDDAIAAYRQTIALAPDLIQAHYNLGNVLHESGESEQAAAAYRKVINMQPNSGHAHGNLGTALAKLGRFDEAIAEYEQAIRLSPDDPMPHANLGVTLLLRGDFERGWREYEWRNKVQPSVPLSQPRWDGGDLNGKRILLHSEQGFGDTIQFIRYIPQVAQRGGQIVVRCPAELIRALRGVEHVLEWNAPGEKLPQFDLHCPLPSLPMLMGTMAATIPAPIPYLKADPELSARWRERVPTDREKVGLVWSGRPTHKKDRDRSMSLELLEPLIQAEGAWFCSLQKSRSENRPTASAAFEGKVNDWTDELSDFADTAALIDNLDLMITVDTAVAHLAGAMGKPVWVLLAFVPDWRWMLDREDSPWYPTMRLFRQPAPGDWQSPIARIVQELQCRK